MLRSEEVLMGVPAAALRPLGASEILDGSVRLLRRNARAALTITVPFAVARALLGAWVSYASLDSRDAVTIAALGGLLLDALVGTVLTGLLAPVFSADLLGTRLGAGEALRRVGGRIWPLVGLSAVITAGEAAGLAMCLVPGAWLWGLWAVAAPALVLERTGVGGGLRRSSALVRGAFWRTFGCRALGWVLRSILGLFVTVPFEIAALAAGGAGPLDQTSAISNPALYVTLLALGGIVSSSLLLPVAAGIDVLIYTDLRMRREGMDIVLGLTAQDGVPGAGPAAVTAW